MTMLFRKIIPFEKLSEDKKRRVGSPPSCIICGRRADRLVYWDDKLSEEELKGCMAHFYCKACFTKRYGKGKNMESD